MDTKKGIAKTFMELVQIDSPTGYEANMTKEVFNILKLLKLKPKIDKEGNVTAKIEGDKTKETYMLNAHMDTVEPGHGIKPFVDKKGWIRSKGDTILGADNKTGVSAIIELAKRLIKEKNSHHPLEIVFTVSEESGNHGAHGLNYKLLKAKKGYIFDASDRDFGALIIASPFYNRFDIRIIGKSSHASKPELAVNVVPIFANAVSLIKLGRINKDTMANIGIISCGQVVNTIPGEITFSGEVRSRDEKDLEKITRQIKFAFQKTSKKFGAKCEVKVVRENGGYKFSTNDPFVKRTIKILTEMKLKPNLIESWGCYEANIFAEHGIMMLNLADGSLDSHTSEERVKVSDLEKLQQMVYKLVLS